MQNCPNCRTHLEVVVHFPIRDLSASELEHASFTVEVQRRGKQFPAELQYTTQVSAVPA